MIGSFLTSSSVRLFFVGIGNLGLQALLLGVPVGVSLFASLFVAVQPWQTRIELNSVMWGRVNEIPGGIPDIISVVIPMIAIYTTMSVVFLVNEATMSQQDRSLLGVLPKFSAVLFMFLPLMTLIIGYLVLGSYVHKYHKEALPDYDLSSASILIVSCTMATIFIEFFIGFTRSARERRLKRRILSMQAVA